MKIKQLCGNGIFSFIRARYSNDHQFFDEMHYVDNEKGVILKEKYDAGNENKFCSRKLILLGW